MLIEYLFEVSWEVCNKVGGINTVVVSKADFMNGINKELGVKNYILIGPYFRKKAYYEFQEKEPSEVLKNVFLELENLGLKFYYGKWLIKGKPNVILVDFSNFTSNRDFIKTKLWEWYGIDSLNSRWDFEEPMIWSWSIGLLIEKVIERVGKKAIVHNHEWMAGASILYLKKSKVSNLISTIFTTHATMLGRSLASNSNNFYEEIKNIDSDKKAYELNVQSKHLTEKALAKTVDIFTTVSEVTGLETEKILGRYPDVILYNGLDFNKFPEEKEIPKRYYLNRKKIKEFCNYYFMPYYNFDVENSLILYTMGRSEYKNKGIDIIIDCLGKLNEELKNKENSKNIVFLFFIPYENLGKEQILERSKMLYEELDDKLEDRVNDIKNKIISYLLKKEDINFEKILGNNLLKELEYIVQDFYSKGNELPLLSTHIVKSNNEIIQGFLRNNLLNRKEDKVKVVLYPVYLTGADGFLNLDIYQAVSGCDLGLFPSYYEPWGYTPLESVALAVPSLTTNLSGFGKYVERIYENYDEEDIKGVFILDRKNKSYDSVVDELKNVIKYYSNLSYSDKELYKVSSRKLSLNCNWKNFIERYKYAYQKCIKKLEE